MGRKTMQGSSKEKEKRLQRKEERIRLGVSQSLVDTANQQADPLLPFPVFKKFNKNGLVAELECKRCADLDKNTMDWVLQLVEKNMRALYEQCEWGWNQKKKLEEMTEEPSWYLIARSPDGKPLGYVYFRFDLDFGDEVLYCYELQLIDEVRRKGLGKFMLQVAELIGFTAQMKKVVLTVLLHNPTAIAFFKSLNYTLDETSPEENVYETQFYEILSKPNKKLLAAAIAK